MNKIYTEESIDAEDAEEPDTEEIDMTVYDERGFELYDPDKHEEVDPNRPVSKIIEYGEDLTTVVNVKDFTKDKTKKKKKPPKKKTKKAVVVGDKQETELEAFPFLPVHKPEFKAAAQRPLQKVIFDGVFGKINAGYLDVYHQGMYLILVEDISAEFSYEPPQSDEEFVATIDDGAFNVIAPGISFRLSNQNIKVTVLLKTGE